MHILGLHTDWHDTGACLIADDKLVAISEERLSRIKNDGNFPALSINYVLADCGLTDINQVDLVVVDHLKNKAPKMEKAIRNFGYKGDIHFISHHDSHAAATYYQSGFDDAAIMIVDGTGSMASVPETGKQAHYHMAGLPEPYELHSYYRGNNSKLHLIDRTVSGQNHRGSIGMFYDGVSYACNFGPFGAGKVMGLAPYGAKTEGAKNTEIIWDDNHKHVIIDGKDKMLPKHYHHYKDSYFNGLPIRDDQELPDEHYALLAHKAQHNCEQAIIHMANHLYNVTQSENLCISGGVGLNSVSNHKLLEATPFKNIFIHPACSDTGIPLGNALYGHHVIKKQTKTFVMKNAYMGRNYSDDEILSALKDKDGISYRKSDNVAKETAQLLADGKIIGWHQGGSEIGPRALGNRSILSDPRPADARDILNLKVKHREWWRPFAPSVLLDHYEEYFELQCPSPYMLLIAKVKEDKQAKIPAVTHVDGTARVQTVTQADNGIYFDLINEFHKLTGVPLLCNTSFNVAGEPIIETPTDALSCVMGTQIDHLIVSNYIVSKT